MKQGNTMHDIMKELVLQQDMKKDYDVSPFRLEMTSDAQLLARGISERPFECTKTMHEQIAQRTGIPTAYYGRMLEENRSLLSQNVNTWLRSGGNRHLTLRTFQGGGEHTARALLSDRYRMVDHLEVTDTVQRVLSQCEGLQLASAALTEDRLYYKYVFPKVSGEIRKGDVVQAGFVISNSETGQGACSILPLLFRLVCTNGMIVASQTNGFRKYHIGRRRGLENDINTYVGDPYDDGLLAAKIEDFLTTRLNDDAFSSYFERMRTAAQAVCTVPVKNLFERVAKKFSLTDSEMNRALVHFQSEGDNTLYGLSNAITRTAQDIASYTRASEMEALGWGILNMDNRTWKALNEAA